MRYLLLIFIVAFYATTSSAQTAIDKNFALTRKSFNPANALTTTAYVEQRWRLPGNQGFNESIYYVEKILKEAGFALQKNNEQEAPLTYRLETRPLNQPTWEPVDASVTIQGQGQPFIQFSSNRNMIPINCPSTAEAGIDAEVVFIQSDSLKSIAKMNLQGKIVFAEAYPGSLIANAVKAGAIGIIGYAMPSYTQPAKYTTSIQFGSIGNAPPIWALFLSYAGKETLKAACQQGKTMLHVRIATRSYQSTELTIVANVRGAVMPDQRLVYSAHVQEPGANDNASGVGTLAEMARITALLVKAKQFIPQRSITFLWGTEITATQRYIKDDSIRAHGILWGMSLDMVGEDTKKTGGSFLIEKMPDPSAIWTRGLDKHTEWGAGSVREKDLFPHYYNDLILEICRAQGRFANWEVNANPFEGGSDHTPFLQNHIPGLLLWHFTDAFYHTDNDRIDKVSPVTMQNVGISALTTGFSMVNADEATALAVVKIIDAAAKKRMEAEFALSRKAVAEGQPAGKEKHITETWSNWYVGALTSIGDLPVKKSSTRVGSAIKYAVVELEERTAEMLKELGD